MAGRQIPAEQEEKFPKPKCNSRDRRRSVSSPFSVSKPSVGCLGASVRVHGLSLSSGPFQLFSNPGIWIFFPAVSALKKSLLLSLSTQEHRHPDCGCLPCAGHALQAGDLAVHLPVANLRGAGPLPAEDRQVPWLQVLGKWDIRCW